MSDLRNSKLRAAREATPSRICPGHFMARSELAELVNEHVWHHHGVIGAVDRKYVARLEAGKVRWPNERYRQALRDILGATSDTDLGFYSAHQARTTGPISVDLQLPWTLDGSIAAITAVTEDNPMDRRAFLSLSSGGLAKLAFDWLVARPADPAQQRVGRIVSHHQVDAIDLVTDDLRRMDDRLGGGAVIDIARSQVRAVAGLLKEGSYDDSVGRRLHASAAELLRFCGWLSWDMGDYGEAQRYWTAALRAAHAAGDGQIGANIMAFWSCQVLEVGEYDDALALSQAAHYRLAGSPKVAAIVNLCRAEAAGAAGEERLCRRAIDDAHDALDKNAEGQPTWAYWVDHNFHEMAGYALFRLGDLDAGIEHLTTYVNRIGPGREQVRGRAFLGSAYAALGEPEQAAGIGLSAIDLVNGDVLSPRSVRQLHNLGEVLSAWDLPEVTEFRENLMLL